MKNKWNVELNLIERNRVRSTDVKGKYRRHKSNAPKRESSGSESCGSIITSYTTSDSSSYISQEPFNLRAWIVNKLGLDINSEEEKSRLNELTVAFRKAGYRKLDAVQGLDNEDLAGIDSELENKLKPGEKKLLKKNL
jgi:hypothetical protein